MNKYIGVDLGTSSSKFLLVDIEGNVVKQCSRSYPVFYPQDGWSEQDPSLWIEALISGVKELTSNEDINEIKGISFGGQMHGLVCLDKEDCVIRNAILWNDGRTEEETTYLNEEIGKDFLSKNTANIAFAGFTLPKILWMKKHELDNYKRINKIMLPKDYLSYYLTGNFVTDYSDASGMLLLDVKNKTWSKKILNKFDIKEEWLPKLKESFDIVGTIKKDIAKVLNLNEDVIVVIGAGDNAAAAIGTGTINNGDVNISLGTSGTVFIACDDFTLDKYNALHSFCHADGKYHLMGCILSAASCNKWWCDNILKTTDYQKEQEELDSLLGKNNIFFLPYLMGERSPHNDANAQSAFIGMKPNTTRKEMTLSIFEGVAFALKDNIEIARKCGIKINSSKICGGGSKSDLWCKIIANVLNVKIERLEKEEGPSYGAAILAMVANKEFSSLEEATKKLVKVKSVIKPDETLVKLYEAKYNIFKRIYPALKEVFH